MIGIIRIRNNFKSSFDINFKIIFFGNEKKTNNFIWKGKLFYTKFSIQCNNIFIPISQENL